MGAQYPLCWTGKRRQRGTRKGKDAWPGSSRRRPMGDQDSLRRTGEDGKVKFWSGCLADIPLAGVPKSEIVWLGGSRRRLTVVSETPCRTGKPCRAWT